MPSNRVFAILLTNQWVEIRAANNPPKRKVTSFTREIEVLQRKLILDPAGRVDMYGHPRHIYHTELAKKAKIFSQHSYVGGRVLCQVRVNDFNKNAIKKKRFKTLSVYRQMVELPEKWAKNFLNPEWRLRNISTALPEEGEDEGDE